MCINKCNCYSKLCFSRKFQEVFKGALLHLLLPVVCTDLHTKNVGTHLISYEFKFQIALILLQKYLLNDTYN